MHFPRAILVMTFVSLVAACGDDDDEQRATVSEVNVPEETTLEAEVLAATDAAISGEYQNEEIYRQVVADFGEVNPFLNIVSAEVKHSDALAALYKIRGLPVPEDTWNAENVPHYESVLEACIAGVEAEQATVNRYNEWLDTLTLPGDVELVFVNLRDASLNEHLLAFQRCVDRES